MGGMFASRDAKLVSQVIRGRFPDLDISVEDRKVGDEKVVWVRVEGDVPEPRYRRISESEVEELGQELYVYAGGVSSRLAFVDVKAEGGSEHLFDAGGFGNSFREYL